MKSSTPENIINHIGLGLDKSSSMVGLADKVVEVAENQIRHLAARSKELDQETRISIWTFAGYDDIQCVVWDKDVLRLPSIRQLYHPYGNTAFMDAAMKAFADMATTSQIYGDHSFLLYFLTDGQENNSRICRTPATLSAAIGALADNWTVAALVPDIHGVHEAKKFGFPAGNIQMWDASTTQGLEEAGESILRSTDRYMRARATGVRSTTSLFDMSATTVNKVTIKAAGLTPLAARDYLLVPVPTDTRIDDFTRGMGHTFVVGRGYYQLSTRSVQVQPQKEIAVVEKATSKVYTGAAARRMLGLPDMTVTIKAGYNPEYDIFIQSTSINRKLLAGTRYLYLVK